MFNDVDHEPKIAVGLPEISKKQWEIKSHSPGTLKIGCGTKNGLAHTEFELCGSSYGPFRDENVTKNTPLPTSTFAPVHFWTDFKPLTASGPGNTICCWGENIQKITVTGELLWIISFQM